MKTAAWLMVLTFSGTEPNLVTPGVRFDTLANCQAMADKINGHFAVAKKERKPVYFCAAGIVEPKVTP